ncbi:MAG: hypothetical protein NTV34_11040 [Proteobacteria bacterium]|nr:hypothetical protein [Pseudomonadota bacterium]
MVTGRIMRSMVVILIGWTSVSCSEATFVPLLDTVALYLEQFSSKSDESISLKSVHLEGPGLLNQTVTVSGEVRVIGQFGTFVVIEDESVRMLVDLTRLAIVLRARKFSQGGWVEVAGRVQAGENGRVYLVANSIRAG